MNEILDITGLKERIDEFANKRDWRQFHTPKNISMALSVEASELLEIFQWLTPEESQQLMDDRYKLGEVSDEIADIFVYLVRLADLLKIDIPAAIDDKMRRNGEKYPAEKFKGSARKYNK